jgi:uncharacterized protein YdaU (DUF1376 family)
MAAKWQQWMPLHIDRFLGSASVRAMGPTASMGYLCLLMAQWQSEDCTIPADPFELAERSGLGDELWAHHGSRILRKFKSVDGNGRLRNAVCFEEWSEAKRVFDARRESASKTNSARSPHGHRTVTDGIPSRSAHTRTTVVPVDVSVPVSVSVEGLSPEMMARGLAERLGISLGYGPNSFNTAVTEVAETEQKAGRNLEDLCSEMEGAYRFYLQEKPGLRIAWGPAKFFGDGHWRDPTGWPRKQKSRQEEIKEWRAPDEEE